MKGQSMLGGRWRVLGLGLAGGGLLALAGCLVIPVDYYQTGSRHNISTKTSGGLRLGISTKEEVLLTLGEPDFVSEDEQRLGYAWTKVKAIWFAAGYTTAASGEVEQSYVLEASFDSSNRVSQVRLLKEWGAEVPPARELKAEP